MTAVVSSREDDSSRAGGDCRNPPLDGSIEQINAGSQPNADMPHCFTSVGHCGYFCRASMI
ncbi:hypothetical protein INR49_001261 [Caranx melampygus]|nr:hypothetical protein INR49_001261 [Caranx melampygus]